MVKQEGVFKWEYRSLHFPLPCEKRMAVLKLYYTFCPVDIDSLKPWSYEVEKNIENLDRTGDKDRYWVGRDLSLIHI